MMTLTIARKLALASLLFLFPNIYVIWTLVAQQNIAIDFSLKEQEGTFYLRGLQAHGLALARAAALGESVDGAAIAANVGELETKYGAGVESAELARAVTTAFATMGAEASPAELEAARTALRALIARVGDKSNLILDPDLDSFYVMDLVLVKLPDMVDRTAAMTTLARADWADGAIGTDEQVDFFVALGALKSLVEGADGSVASGYSGNADGSLKESLDAPYSGSKAAMAVFTESVTKASVDNAAAGRTLDAVDGFYDKSSSELERLLDKRIDGFKSGQMTTLAIASVLFLLAIGGVLAIIMRTVIRPLGRLTSTMRHLAGGDLEIDIAQAEDNNEIGDMARALKVFRENSIRARALETEREAERRRQLERAERTKSAIVAFEGTISEVVSVVSTSSDQLQTTAQSMSSTAEETAQQAGAAATASSVTSGNVQTVAAATEQLSASIGGIRQQAGEAARIVGEAAAQATDASGRVHRLAQSATKIEQVITLINEIAAQTNLLALNATIEAARAGEAGKGFAVVAQEVKSLAGQTARATEEIVAQVGAIQSATKLSVQAIDAIAATIARVSDLSGAIEAAVNEQGAATQEISRSVGLAASGTSEVSSNVSAVTMAAQNAGQASHQVLASARELAKHSAGLKTQVESFLTAVRA